MTDGLKVSFSTLGCKVNQTESEALAQLLTTEGYKIVDESEHPDVIIINTCTVTGSGSSKSRKTIRRMAKDNPQSTIAVMGCYSQTKPEEVSQLEGVDLVLGTQERSSLLEHLRKVAEVKQDIKDKKIVSDGLISEKMLSKDISPVVAVKDFSDQAVYEELPLMEGESRARAMLKIQDGCSQFCTYCIIPYARGPARSRSPEKVTAEARRLVEAGHKEIVLTGIHTGAYGRDQEGMDLAKLIFMLVEIPNLTRLRISSIESIEFSDNLLRVAAENRVVCPHFHIPLQSGTDSILARMKRPYSVKDYAEVLDRIRDKIPEAAITTDIMTGFPGESEAEHEQSLKFVESCEFADLHVFPYSRREGTPAAEMPGQLSRSLKNSRVQELIALGQKSRDKYIEKFIGQPLEVLVERIGEDGSAQGHTANYIEVRLPGTLNPGDWDIGQLISYPLKKEYIIR